MLRFIYKVNIYGWEKNMLKKFLFTFCCVLMLAGLIVCEAKSRPMIEEIVTEGENRFTCTFEGVKHDVILDLPEVTEDAPLVVMLHGYGGTAESFRSSVHLEEEANALGYAVAYVTGAPDPNDATSSNGWNSGIGAEGNADVAFLVALAEYLAKEYELNEERIYAVGFSNGAFMTQRLALEAGDTYAAVVSVAGMMPERIWNGRGENNMVSVFQITGEKDDVVPKHSDGSAKYAQAPAIEDVMSYWADSNELSLTEMEKVGMGSTLEKYSSQDSVKQVWHLRVKDGRHSWPEEQFTGINMNEMILLFLETQ